MTPNLSLGLGAILASGSSPIPPITAISSTSWIATIDDPGAFIGPISFMASRGGFDSTGSATTYTETLKLTSRVFNAYTDEAGYGDATLSTDNGALSDFVYPTDTISGLTLTGLLDSPVPVVQWLTVDRSRCGNTLTVEITANHRDGIACTELRASDGTTTVSAKSATRVISTNPTDLLPVECYRFELDVSTLANPATLDVNVKVWPRLGGTDSIFDSADIADTTANRRLASVRKFRRDTSARLCVAVVDSVAGGGSTTPYIGTDEALAVASPATTISAALSRYLVAIGNDLGGLRVLLMGKAVHGVNAPTTTPTGTPVEEITIEPAPGVSRADAIVEWGSANVTIRAPYVRFKGVTIDRVGTVGNFAFVAGGHAVFEDCIFNNQDRNAGLSTVAGTGTYFTGCTITGAAVNTFAAGTNHEIRMIRGCSVVSATAGTSYNVEMFNVHGSQLTDANSSNAAARNASGQTVTNSIFLNMKGASPLWVNAGGDVTGGYFANLVCEYTSSTSNPLLRFSGDGDSNNTNHVVIVHCTFAGFHNWGRANLLYNETANVFRTHTLHRDWGNIYVSLNTKHDFFAGLSAVAGDATLRTGGWSYLYGVGSGYNWMRYRDAGGGNWSQHYAGEGSEVGTATTGAGLDPLFTDYEGSTDNGAGGATAGAGGGDYTLAAESPCRALAPVKPWTPAFGIDGTARSGTVQLGAYAA